MYVKPILFSNTLRLILLAAPAPYQLVSVSILENTAQPVFSALCALNLTGRH